MLTAECLCGAVAYQSDATPAHLSHCHCSRCRKVHGSAFASYAAVPARSFRFVRGKDAVVRYEGGGTFQRPFCRYCGSVVPGDVVEGEIFLPAGPLEGDLGRAPIFHIFVGSKAPWYEISDTLPRHDAYSAETGLPAMPTRAVAPPTPGGPVRGSCLCDGVRFEVSQPFGAARNCHCARCRRGRAAAHASNLFAPASQIRFTRGADRVASYKVPDAERFTQFFCTTCGGKLPRPGDAPVPIAIPMGALDDDPGVRPQCHIFVTSKAPWYEIAGPLPRYEAYPPPA